MRRFLLPLLLTALAACSTVNGAGQDLSKAGNFVSETARDVQRKM